jgi:hypothetical protein
MHTQFETDCGCIATYTPTISSLVYCNTHRAAPRMLEALKHAADIQHETSRWRGEVDCTDETPCLFCAAIAAAE